MTPNSGHALRAGKALVALLVLVAGLAAARGAWAHQIGLSRGVYGVSGAQVQVEVTLRALPAASRLLESLDVAADGAKCTPTLEDAAPDPPDGVQLRATYLCPQAVRRLRLHLGFLDRMPAGHRHLATVHLPRGDLDVLASADRPDIEVEVSGGASRGFASLVRGGVDHILSGADHLAFLFALVLAATLRGQLKARPLLLMLTAFTVGHSLSLALATLGAVAPGARLVEPAVALSVAYVGAENLFSRGAGHDLGQKWRVTLPFGFVHGFAFAGGLLPLGLPRQELPAALLAFNLGVELGQIAVLALLLPLLALVHARPWYPRAARAASAAIVLAGLVWFVQRVA